MLLSELMKDVVDVSMVEQVEVTGLTLNSRDVVSGYAFVALNGSGCHGADYISSAVSAGAVAVLLDLDGEPKAVNCTVPVVKVSGLRNKLGEIAARFYVESSIPKVIGVTGTDGKTTVSQLISQLLADEKSPCGVIGTLGAGIGNKLTNINNTTPDVISVHRFLAKMAREGSHYVAMEVSSHGLDQQRVNGVSFCAAVLTNLGHDHLDYHTTLENYAAAKRKLFGRTGSINIINIDDAFGQAIVSELAESEVLTYGLGTAADVKAENIRLSADRTAFDLVYRGETVACETQLVGKFNIYNMLAAIAAALVVGKSLADILAKLSLLEPIVGRMERIVGQNGKVAIVDFAHTPNALENALAAVSEIEIDRLIVVLGCGGDRDVTKRAPMATFASKVADFVVLTNDNPRTESPEKIVNDMLVGIVDTDKVHVIYDRKAAIEFALAKATARDVVFIAGKGHENYQEINGIREPFSDQAVVRAVLEAA